MPSSTGPRRALASPSCRISPPPSPQADRPVTRLTDFPGTSLGYVGAPEPGAVAGHKQLLHWVEEEIQSPALLPAAKARARPAATAETKRGHPGVASRISGARHGAGVSFPRRRRLVGEAAGRPVARLRRRRGGAEMGTGSVRRHHGAPGGDRSVPGPSRGHRRRAGWQGGSGRLFRLGVGPSSGVAALVGAGSLVGWAPDAVRLSGGRTGAGAASSMPGWSGGQISCPHPLPGEGAVRAGCRRVNCLRRSLSTSRRGCTRSRAGWPAPPARR